MIAENLVAVCWLCNSGKADVTIDEFGRKLLGASDVQSTWDGLTGIYSLLWQRAQEPDAPYHRHWLLALARTD